MEKIKAVTLSLVVIILMILGLRIAQAEQEKDLVLYFTFDEAQDQKAEDLSGNGNDGAIKGGAKWEKNGKIGGALSFDGKNGYVEAPSSDSLSPTKEITIAAWINSATKPAAVGVGAFTIVRKEGAYILQITAEGMISFAVWIGGNLTAWKTCVVPEPDWEIKKWYHVAGLYDAKEYKIYLDGTLKQSSKVGGQITTNEQPVCIGSLGGSNFFYTGLIDEVKIWSRALTEEEIKLSMMPVKPVSLAGTLATIWGALKAPLAIY